MKIQIFPFRLVFVSYFILSARSPIQFLIKKERKKKKLSVLFVSNSLTFFLEMLCLYALNIVWSFHYLRWMFYFRISSSLTCTTLTFSCLVFLPAVSSGTQSDISVSTLTLKGNGSKIYSVSLTVSNGCFVQCLWASVLSAIWLGKISPASWVYS